MCSAGWEDAQGIFPRIGSALPFDPAPCLVCPLAAVWLRSVRYLPDLPVMLPEFAPYCCLSSFHFAIFTVGFRGWLVAMKALDNGLYSIRTFPSPLPSTSSVPVRRASDMLYTTERPFGRAGRDMQGSQYNASPCPFRSCDMAASAGPSRHQPFPTEPK